MRAKSARSAFSKNSNNQSESGSAAAMLGFIQFALGGLGGSLVSYLDNGTAMPMVGVITVAGILALLINLVFAPKEALHMN